MLQLRNTCLVLTKQYEHWKAENPCLEIICLTSLVGSEALPKHNEHLNAPN